MMGNITYRGTKMNGNILSDINDYLTLFCENMLSVNPDILTLSDDIGQHEWGTLSVKPTGNSTTPFAWNIFKFSDGLGPDFYIKFEYFYHYWSGQVNSTITMRASIGKSTNGSGVIQDVILTRCLSGYKALSNQDYFYTNRITCHDGFFCLSIHGQWELETGVARDYYSDVFCFSRLINEEGYYIDKILHVSSLNSTNMAAASFGDNSYFRVIDINTFNIEFECRQQDIISRLNNNLELYRSQVNSYGNIRYHRVILQSNDGFVICPNLIVSKIVNKWDYKIKTQDNKVFSEWGCFANGSGITFSETSETSPGGFFSIYVRWE